jgi:ribonuclease T1
VRLIAAFLAVVFSFSVLGKDVSSKDIPPEARQTLALIKQNGPFPYSQDGKTFGNREKLLPMRAGGYYREYTVKTPGARDRGARRIVAGNGGELYYTDDHYRSFSRVRE